MYSLVYRSTASPKIDASDIEKINAKSIAFNTQNNITGCLLYHKGKFVQILEGSKKSVIALFNRIEKDTLHSKVQVLQTEQSPSRMFANWDMVFDNFDLKESEHTVNKINLFHNIYHSSNAPSAPNRCKLEFWKHVTKILSHETNGLVDSASSIL